MGVKNPQLLPEHLVMGCKMLDNLMMAFGAQKTFWLSNVGVNPEYKREKFVSFSFRANSQGEDTSTVRRKYAYHFSRLQMMIVSRFIMVGLFPPCCTSLRRPPGGFSGGGISVLLQSISVIIALYPLMLTSECRHLS